MAVQSANMSALYSDIVASLIPYIEDQVLLPNTQFIRNFYDISGDTAGKQIKIPLVNAYSDGQEITEGTSISNVAAANNAFVPTSVTLTMKKLGAWTDVTFESVEDGAESVVREQILTRMSSALSQGIDKDGFAELAGSGATDYGVTTANVVAERNVVMGPDSVAYGLRRSPTVNLFSNIDSEIHQFRSSVRAGFKTLEASRVALVSGSNTIAAASNVATLANFQEAVSNLRASNVLSGPGSMYFAFIGPATEYALVSELNNVGASQIASLSDVGNQTLLTALLGSAVGAMFYRTNNLTVETNA